MRITGKKALKLNIRELSSAIEHKLLVCHTSVLYMSLFCEGTVHVSEGTLAESKAVLYLSCGRNTAA